MARACDECKHFPRGGERGLGVPMNLEGDRRDRRASACAQQRGVARGCFLSCRVALLATLPLISM
jgi:hypothetical protein